MSMINCPNCSAQVPAGAAFCDNCGSSLASVAARPGAPGGAAAGADQARCPNCGESVMAGEAFCGNCGTALSTAAPAVFVPPPPPPPIQSGRDWSNPGAMPTDVNTCPNCGAMVQDSDVFCDNCGHALPSQPGFPSGQQVPAQTQPASDPSMARPSPQPPVVNAPTLNPRLVVAASGATLALPAGKTEYLIGREDPVSGSFPDIDLVPYGGEEGGVSRRHAQIAGRGGQFTIEDLNSVNYTFVNRQKIAPGSPHPLRDGDEIRLGRVVLQFKTS